MIGQSFGNYTVVRRLGVGGMGEVWEAQQPTIGARVAVKVLNADAADPHSEQRFLIEAQAVNRIGHDGAVKILDAGYTSEGRPYLVMEYLDGAPLVEVMHAAARLPMGSACRVIADVLDVLGAAHAEGIVHRDLKPHNIFLTRGGRTVVLDFGVAKLLDTDAPVSLTLSGAIVGTPAYMAPEQIQGDPVDGRADLYAIGVVLYELVCGRRPFDDDATVELLTAHVERRPPPPRAIRPDVPAAVQAVVMSALAKAPADRFQTAEAMRTALLQAVTELPAAAFAPIEIPGAPPKRTPTAPPRRSPSSPPADDSSPDLAATTVPMPRGRGSGPHRAGASRRTVRGRTGPAARVTSEPGPGAPLALAVTAPEASRTRAPAPPPGASTDVPRSRRPLAVGAIAVGVGAVIAAFAIGRLTGARDPAPQPAPEPASPAATEPPPAAPPPAAPPPVAALAVPSPVADRLFRRKLHVADLPPATIAQLHRLQGADAVTVSAATDAILDTIDAISVRDDQFLAAKLRRIETRWAASTLPAGDRDLAEDHVDLARALLDDDEPDELDANEHLWQAEWLLEHGREPPRRLR